MATLEGADSVEEDDYDRSLDYSQTFQTFSDFMEREIETYVDSCDVKAGSNIDGDTQDHSGGIQDI